jgi:hypothetical protein
VAEKVNQQQLAQKSDGADRHQRGGKCLARVPDLLFEALTADAGLDVAPHGRARLLDQALGGLAELLADLIACQQPRLGGLGK